jgi:hypothetical protein
VSFASANRLSAIAFVEMIAPAIAGTLFNSEAANAFFCR